MRYPPHQKAETRQRILEAGARTFKRHGFHGGGVDAVMSEAGLTAGAFYRHFESKEQLFTEVIQTALSTHRAHREEGLELLEGLDWIEGLVRRYLSVQHLETVEDGCPLPTLVSEVTRASEATRTALANGLDEWAAQIAARLPLEDAMERDQLSRQLISTMVGGLALARSLEPEAARAHVTHTANDAVLSLRTRCAGERSTS